jgi:hypothetical protein
MVVAEKRPLGGTCGSHSKILVILLRPMLIVAGPFLHYALKSVKTSISVQVEPYIQLDNIFRPLLNDSRGLLLLNAK